jgi:hypothetical protein
MNETRAPFKASVMSHVEAFCVMTYLCKRCGKNTFYWNSRDGVTPFVVRSPCCHGYDAEHIHFQNDVPMDELPGFAEFVFVDMSLDDARLAANNAFECTNQGPDPADKDQLIEQITRDIYGDGVRPMVISRGKYLQRMDSQ